MVGSIAVHSQQVAFSILHDDLVIRQPARVDDCLAGGDLSRLVSCPCRCQPEVGGIVIRHGCNCVGFSRQIEVAGVVIGQIVGEPLDFPVGVGKVRDLST